MATVTPVRAGAGGLAAGILGAVALLAPFEGERTHAYLDPGKVATICYGETEGVKLGQTKTHQECLNLLDASVRRHTAEMQSCLKVPVQPETAAGMISFGYNVGTATFCRTVADDFNHGRTVKGCDRMKLYIYQKSYSTTKPLPGLVTRRGTESAYCLRGLNGTTGPHT